MTYTDEDIFNHQNLILLYSGISFPKSQRHRGGSSKNKWNREHVWPKSHGFPNKAYLAYTDLHHIRPAFGNVNSSRGTKDFDNGGKAHKLVENTYVDKDSWEPRPAIKGDIARMMFYMDVRYEGEIGDMPDLVLIDGNSLNSRPTMGHLCTLLEWSLNDPVDDLERLRHNRIIEIQGNRNPFIDRPELAIKLWGDKC